MVQTSRRRLAATAVALAAIVVSGALLTGCSSRQQVDLSVNGSGTAQIRITLSPILVSYLQDLAATVAGVRVPADQPVFDLSALHTAFSRYPALALESASTPHPDTLDLSVRFRDVAKVFSAAMESGPRFATFSDDGGTKTLSITVDRETIAAVLGLTPLSGSVAADVLLPPKGDSMSPDQYVSYLSWALEDYAKGQDIRKVIEDARIDLNIRVAGTVISQNGGRQEGNTVIFSLPVTELVTLQKAANYSITFR